MDSPCRNNNWKKSIDFTDQYGNKRYWFDCGKFYYDGKFNVVEFPQNLSMYHGSIGLVWYNVEFPLGNDAYNPGTFRLSPVDKNYLQNPNVSPSRKTKFIHEKMGISTGWYGDYEVASIYSTDAEFVTDDGRKIHCGPNCVAAYKSKKPLIFINLYDPYNLKILLEDTSIPVRLRTYLAQSQVLGSNTGGITEALNIIKDLAKSVGRKYNNDPTNNLQQAYHPIRRFVGRTSRTTMRRPDLEDQYILPNYLINLFINKGYAGYVNPRTPYLDHYGNPKGGYRFAEMVFGRNVLDYIERDLDNSLDWQHETLKNIPPTIRNLIKDMKKYKTSNVNFHSGNLYEHSVWTLLYADSIYTGQVKEISKEINVGKGINIGEEINKGINAGKKIVEWGYGIPKTSQMRQLINVTAFLHDIGKAGDLEKYFYSKPDHPEIGADYILQNIPYEIKTSDGKIKTLNIKNLLSEFGLTDSVYIKIISALIRNHWYFGDYLRHINSSESNIRDIAQRFIDKIIKNIKKIKIPEITNDKIEILLYFRIQMLLAAADLLATQPYTDHTKLERISNHVDSITTNIGIQPKTEEYRKRALNVRGNINANSERYPFLSNQPKVYPGGNKYFDFDYSGRGLRLRKEILRNLEIKR